MTAVRQPDANGHGLEMFVGLMETFADRVARRVVEQLREDASGQSFPELMTLSEAAKRLRVSETTIRRWKRDGVLPTERIGRRVLTRSTDVLAILVKSGPSPLNPTPVDSVSNPEVERVWARLTRKVG